MMYPKNHNDIKIFRGNTTYICIIPTYNGEIYTLTENDTIKFTVKQNTAKGSPIEFEKILTIRDYDIENKLIIKIKPSDTENFNFSNHIYDCGININGDFSTFIPPTKFTVLPVCTESFDIYENDNLSAYSITGEILLPKVVNFGTEIVTDDTLTGNGTVANPLGIMVWVKNLINSITNKVDKLTNEEYSNIINLIN